MNPADLPLLRPPGRLDYAKAAAGRWITIGGTKGEDGKRRGGSPVFVENGVITRGHPGLTGRKIASLDQPAEHKPQQRVSGKAKQHEAEYTSATWAKRAKAEGIDPKGLHQLAGEIKCTTRRISETLPPCCKRPGNTILTSNPLGPGQHGALTQPL